MLFGVDKKEIVYFGMVLWFCSQACLAKAGAVRVGCNSFQWSYMSVSPLPTCEAFAPH